MPKMKTSGSAKKRFKITGSGSISRKRAFHRHLMVGKNAKRRRNQRGSILVHESDEKRIKQLLALA